MKVRIVCYEEVNAWILGKFARNMQAELAKLSVDADISNRPDPGADVNHHIIYTDYDGAPNGLDTVMITHIDEVEKVKLLKSQLVAGRMGVCMSRETMLLLADAGIPADRLCYINPAHDGVMRPRKMVIGITSKVHSDGRKNEGFLERIAAGVETGAFRFVIMGSGWEPQVARAREAGLEIEYHSQFDRDAYIRIMPQFDYYVYFSHDEGSMGFLDALAAGVKTIVTPQGYHLDAVGGITHAIDDCDDLIKVLRGISAERSRLVQSVGDWTWARYAEKHLELWKAMRAGSLRAPGGPVPYRDGIYSVGSGSGAGKPGFGKKWRFYSALYRNSISRFMNQSRKVKAIKRLLGLKSTNT